MVSIVIHVQTVIKYFQGFLDSRLRDCAAILICHCQTPLRRCGNLNRTRGCNPLFNKESMGLLRSLCSLAKTLRHSLEDRNPILLSVSWIPAFAGVTIRGVLQRSHLLKGYLMLL